MRQFSKLVAELKNLVVEHRPGEMLPPPPLMPSMDINGVRVAFVQAGMDNSEDTPPVVFLHGFGGFFMDWPRVMAPVSKHTRVYALDLPGWGFSEPNRKAERMEDDASIVAAFIRNLGLRNVILCGISYGAAVTWAVASTRVPRVKHAVLLNPMPPFPMKHLRSKIYQTIFLTAGLRRLAILGNRLLTKAQYKIICRENLLNDRLLDTFYLDLAYLVMKQPKMPFILHAHSIAARKIDWADWEHRLAGIKIPVSILQGTQDRIFSMESALLLHRLIPTSELIEVPNCGHAMVFDQHRKVSDHLIGLIAAQSNSSQTTSQAVG